MALEAVNLHTDGSIDGIEQTQRDCGGYTVTSVVIKDENGERKSGKRRGEYITVELPDILFADVYTAAQTISENIGKMLKKYIEKSDGKSAVLVAGIGNRNITPDALGPFVSDRILATKHAAESGNAVFDSFSPVAVIAPGVLGQTGLEAGEILKGIVDSNDICAVIAVDALAASSVSRLGNTVQITDTGISPGSGVQNSRREISAETMGVPVVAVGVPTVADADITAVCDTKSSRMFITPRDIDEIIERNSRIIALAVNMALQPDFTAQEIEAMTM